jgi:chromosome segregation ATPase
LTKNVDTLRKAFEAQKLKIPAMAKEIEDLKKMLHERGLKTNEEFQFQLAEKEREIQHLQQNLKSLKEAAQEAEKQEDLFKEKERVLRQMIQDKEATVNEFKNRVHSLERRLDEFGSEKESIKAEANKEVEKVIKAKDRELEERIQAQKEELYLGFQQEVEKAKFQAAKEAAEKVRAEMPPVTANPELIRQEMEREMMTQLRDQETAAETKMKEVRDEAKRDLDKFKWETESLKEELKRAREARNQIEKEAQELLQQAEEHYKSQLEKKMSDIKDKTGKHKGLFTSIAKILDTPIIDFSKKKDGE